MENEKIKAVLNDVLIDKLNIIALDIKYYININASIADSLDEESKAAFEFMDVDDINEILKIRHRIKQLAYNLKNKLNKK